MRGSSSTWRVEQAAPDQQAVPTSDQIPIRALRTMDTVTPGSGAKAEHLGHESRAGFADADLKRNKFEGYGDQAVRRLDDERGQERGRQRPGSATASDVFRSRRARGTTVRARRAAPLRPGGATQTSELPVRPRAACRSCDPRPRRAQGQPRARPPPDAATAPTRRRRTAARCTPTAISLNSRSRSWQLAR